MNMPKQVFIKLQPVPLARAAAGQFNDFSRSAVDLLFIIHILYNLLFEKKQILNLTQLNVKTSRDKL